MRPTLKFMRLS